MSDVSGEIWGIGYVSAASQPFTVEEMTTIKQEIQSDCSSKNISGILIYAEGNVLCFIEGPKDIVLNQYNQVLRDTRHKNLVKLFSGPILSRYFEDFGLALKFEGNRVFASLDDFNTIERQVYLDECLNMEDKVMKLISDFIKNNK